MKKISTLVTILVLSSCAHQNIDHSREIASTKASTDVLAIQDSELAYTPTMHRELRCIDRLANVNISSGNVTSPFIEFAGTSRFFTFIPSQKPRLGYYVITESSNGDNAAIVSFYPITDKAKLHDYGYHLKMKLGHGVGNSYLNAYASVDRLETIHDAVSEERIAPYQYFFYDRIDEVKGAGSMAELNKYIHQDLIKRISQVNGSFRSVDASFGQNRYMYLDALNDCRQYLNSKDIEAQNAITHELKKFEDKDLLP